MNSPHQDLSQIKKLENSIVLLSQNEEATFGGIATESPKSRTKI